MAPGERRGAREPNDLAGGGRQPLLPRPGQALARAGDARHLGNLLKPQIPNPKSETRIPNVERLGWLPFGFRIWDFGFQNSAFPGVRGNGITSRMLVMPVTNCTVRSSPRPKPECGTVP